MQSFRDEITRLSAQHFSPTHVKEKTTKVAHEIERSMLLLTPIGGWHHALGEFMIIRGIAGMLLAGLGALRRDHGHGLNSRP